VSERISAGARSEWKCNSSLHLHLCACCALIRLAFFFRVVMARKAAVNRPPEHSGRELHTPYWISAADAVCDNAHIVVCAHTSPILPLPNDAKTILRSHFASLEYVLGCVRKRSFLRKRREVYFVCALVLKNASSASRLIHRRERR
jgi:hypothetical protein